NISESDFKPAKLVQAEDRVKGKVTGEVYKSYFDEAGMNGYAVMLLLLALYSVSQGVRTIVDWWQGHWARNMARDGVDPSFSNLKFGMWYLAFIQYQMTLQNIAVLFGSLVVSAMSSYWIGISYIPMSTTFVVTLTGLHTIRAFKMEHKFIGLNKRVVDENTTAYFTYWAACRWLAVRLDWMSVVVIFVVSLYLVSTKGQISGVVAGISLTYSLML
ncbi:hypothetical protein PybrP1_001274, partial [[Pythium] brassicae (nom. inval.)]